MPKSLYLLHRSANDSDQCALPPAAADRQTPSSRSGLFGPSTQALSTVSAQCGALDVQSEGCAMHPAAGRSPSLPSVAPLEQSGSGTWGAAVSTADVRPRMEQTAAEEGTPYDRLAAARAVNLAGPPSTGARRPSAVGPFSCFTSEYFCAGMQHGGSPTRAHTQDERGADSITEVHGVHCTVEANGVAALCAAALPNASEFRVVAADQL
ncbi:hypothetical protein STCU_10769 [Strigomonas culicis]|uniref:Uncharacterized protein n=1 Tax=Strigomonas culicis TaxID=28005 RepID=S9TLF8_9TRYP|nr:hypothetical protein STCU_10769 [Strigomonas culicis]|eukprot:EPY17188.1 hypothetical protein STCU_10769 [Strigomonas culicis]